MECKREQNLENCNCSYIGCVRKGICCECVKHHRARKQLPACYFGEVTEKTYDRSIDNFLKDRVTN